ncbi:reverse transcriptase domain-containing protein [Tanacetum coccineum]
MKPTHKRHHDKRAYLRKGRRMSESEDSAGGHWMSKSKKQRSSMEDEDLSQPWAATKVERWAMPTWCHVFNSTLTGNARVWFDDLPPESKASYDDLKEAFLANYLQQKKCIKDPVEIHHIKQREGESTEDFVRRFKIESKDVKGVPKVMRISGFMHGITNPELIKRLHDKISKSVDEMMKITTAFLRGEVTAGNQERKKAFPPWKQQDAGHRQNFKKGGFKNHQRPKRRQDMFTFLSKTPKEILALEKGKFKALPPMMTPVKKQNSNKFCEFHKEEIKQNSGKDQQKVNKKGEASGKNKSLAILMIQPWQRMARQIITQSFSPHSEISFPPIDEEESVEGPMIIEAEVGGHFIHRMYVDGGPASEILYEHCFNKLLPEVKSKMVPATAPLTRSASPYNGIIGRPGIRKIQAVTLTAHGMLKFPVEGGDKSGNKPRASGADDTLLEKGRDKLCDLLRRNLDVFAWKPADMTGVPRHIAKHQLNIREGATYQRLVDKAFHKQIGRNLEVYVDDLVIKSRNEDEIIRDIEETFRTLREINMKLNPKKCIFGVEEGMFLGYKVNTKGLNVCPDKVDDVLSLPSPKCLKDVQKLNGKLASLNRFLAKSAKKSLSFFKTLKRCTKKSDSCWTDEAESAFRQMKQHIAEIPMLTAPEEKEELIVYLAAAKETISAVLITEREAKQIPIYFISHTLRGLEVNYTSMEKLVLALVHASKHLKRYFQAHLIIVITDQPIKTDHGRLYSRATRRRCYDGDLGRTSGTVDIVYGWVILRRWFRTTNNKAGYEALIAVLRVAEQMETKNLQANVDSRLVPRSENKKADALSKIASTSFSHLSKQVLVEELKEKSINEVEVLAVVEEEGETWMTPIHEYLAEGILPAKTDRARAVRQKSLLFVVINRILYKKSFLSTWLRCVGPLQANYVLREIHEGSCSMHACTRSVVSKALQIGYYWPTMHKDERTLIWACKDCQENRPILRNPQQKLNPITSPWPFYKWGIDIAGPFPEGPGKVKFLIVAIDYFTKWIEAKPVATITGNQIKKFVWDNIVCRSGLPREIISENGKQFRDNPFKDWCEKLCIC